ncbi:GTP-binding protein [Halalkalibacter kiskunsagensis]|uniref:GTP-binding protein n=1 Tax=Halalkalibacter kiskunsagensis TaxID=1548599 RepID=A0ABV6KGQ2_9BACI
MTVENELIKKIHYKNNVESHDGNLPIKSLAEEFLVEQKSEESNLSTIRFAQGEVYYHCKDFETAIFKWQNVHNELEPWAKKNIADSYYELGQLTDAEEMYLSINTDNIVLTTEIELQLFSVYMDQQLLDQAAKVIKNIVAMNPDYPTVTDVARSFFEEYRDWSSAIELAVSESLRTESIEWYGILNTYIDKGLTKSIEPAYFTKTLQTLFTIDEDKFEQMAIAFWNSYEQENYYFSWIVEFDHLFLQMEVKRSNNWEELSRKYKETYLELINGSYYLSELENVIPNLLTNWLKVTGSSELAIVSTAVLAWNELRPSSINQAIVNEANTLLKQGRISEDGLEQSLLLFESIMQWADEHELKVGNRLKWMIQELLNFNVNHLLVIGSSANEQSSFMNLMVGETNLEELNSTVMLKYGKERLVRALTDKAIHQDVEADLEVHLLPDPHILEYCLPSSFLHENSIALLHSPKLGSSRGNKRCPEIHLADRVLFVLDAHKSFGEDERYKIGQIQKLAPNLPIHFLINKLDAIYNEQEINRMIEETKSRILMCFPNAKVFTFSRVSDMPKFLSEMFKNQTVETERNGHLLQLIRTTITHLLEKRVDMESQLMDEITWNEEMVIKLTGANNQLVDAQKEKMQGIKQSYHVIIQETKKDLKVTIPKLLQNCSSFVREKSDFRTIHLELNQKMNEQIKQHLEQTAIPKLANSLQQWLEIGNVEFIQSQSFLKEMSEGFNALYGEERLKLQCDFRVLDDWYRDIDRMTNGVHLDNVNILLRLTPSQILLKSSGKLFGVLPTNKAMLQKMYKKFIENEDYKQIADSVSNQFLMQFELFEKALDRDMDMFFRNPFNVFNEATEEAQSAISEKNEALHELKSSPEKYQDPLALFKLKLYQYELMEQVVKSKGKERVSLK